MGYLAVASGAFLAGLGLQYLIYTRFLVVGLRPPGADQAAVVKRWLALTAAAEALVIIACLAYFAAGSRSHASGVAWIAPPLGALVGSAIGLQLGVARLARIATG